MEEITVGGVDFDNVEADFYSAYCSLCETYGEFFYFING